MSGEISQSSLAVLLLLSVVFGFVAALLYDALRIRRIAINVPILWHFEDFFFMLGCGVVFSILFYVQSSGKVRAFAFAGGLGGFYIYRKTLGRLVMAASERIINFVKYIIHRVVLPPVNFVIKLLRRAAETVKRTLFAVLGKITLRAEKRRTAKQIKAFTEAALFGFGEKNKNSRNKMKRGLRE